MPVDRIPMQAPGYVNAARRDPDGSAVRLALNRKVTVNSMAAGEKLFVDLLPEGWTGLPPGLPQEVVEELARRAREAEKKARAQQQRRAQQRALPPVRVRVGVQPTFTRYTFGLPALIAVSTERNDDKMTMTFEAPLRFDLADVQAALPPMIAADRGAGGRGQRRWCVSSSSARWTCARSARTTITSSTSSRSRRAPKRRSANCGRRRLAAIARRAEQRRAPAPAAGCRDAAPRRRAAEAPAGKPPSRSAAQAAEPADRRPAEPKPAASRRRSRRAEARPSRRTPRRRAAVRRRAAEPIPARDGARTRSRAPADPAAPVVVDVRRQGEARAADLPVRRADAGRDVPARRHDLAGVRQPGADRHRQDRRAVGPQHPQRDRHALAATARWSSSSSTSRSSPAPAPTESTWTVIVGDMMLEPTQPLSVVRVVQSGGRASVSIPFEEPRQLHRLVRRGGRRHAAGRHRARARARLSQAAGIRRIQRAGLDPWRGDPAARRRRHRRGRPRQDRGRRARAASRCRARARAPRRPARARRRRAPRQPGPVHARSAGLGLRPRGEFPRPPDASGRRGRRGGRGAAHAGAARARALLPGARPDRRSQGRARRRGRPTSAPTQDGTAAGAARHRQHHARARRRRHEGPVAAPRSASATTRRCGARSRWRSRENGPRRAKASARSRPRPRRCRSNCSASPSRKPCARRSRCATSARAASLLNEFDTLGPARGARCRAHRAQGTRDGRARTARRGAHASIAAAAEIAGPPGRGARTAARDRAAPVDRRDEARGRDRGAGDR